MPSEFTWLSVSLLALVTCFWMLWASVDLSDEPTLRKIRTVLVEDNNPEPNWYGTSHNLLLDAGLCLFYEAGRNRQVRFLISCFASRMIR